MNSLFAYGTLKDPDVFFEVTGEHIHIVGDDVLCGYKLEKLVYGSDIYPIIIETGNMTDKVTGLLLKVKIKSLGSLDNYEGDDYRRIAVILESGAKAWVYCK